MLGPAGPSGSVMELRFFRGLGAWCSRRRRASRSASLGVPVSVGQEGEELSGAEWSWGGTFCRLCSNTFIVAKVTLVSLNPISHTRARITNAAV